MRKRSTIFALLLSVTTSVFANWTGSISEPELRTKIEGKEFYLISTPEELAWFAAQVNSGKTEINAQLANDIVLWEDSLTSSSNATNWIPIGDSLTKAFNGIFDGKNHKIHGLYIHEERKITYVYRTDSICIGLFGSLGYKGVVKNLNIENAYLNIHFTPKASTDKSMSENSANIGGVIGLNKGNIENISFKGSVETGGNLGGLIGRNNGYIENVAFEGFVGFGYGKIGGIVGYNTGSIKKATASGKIQSRISPTSGYESYIGGIAGYVENGLVIENCKNNADIADSTTRVYIKNSGYTNVGVHTYVGGIVGYVNTSTSIINSINNGTLQANLVGGIAGLVSSATIVNCKNEGTILGKTDWYSESSGGIIGSGKSVQILNSTNNSLISSVYRAAGIAGDLDSNSTIDNCVNNGVIKAPRAAGVVGNGRSLVKNSINNDSIVGGTTAAGIIADYLSYASTAYGIGNAKVFENCTNYGVVFANYSSNTYGGSSSVMGIGYAELIEKCTNNGTVISKEYVSSGYISACNEASHTLTASGIGVGNIKNCVNNGNVAANFVLSATNYVDHVCNINVYAGGITASLDQNISKSVNRGSVDAYSNYSHNVNKINYGVGNGFVYAGGLVGKASENVKITDSYNLGNVNATNYVTISGSNSYDNRIWVGGIAGYVRGNGETFIRNVYSAADSVTGLGKNINYSYSGALFGQTDGKKIYNAYYDSKIKSLSIPIADVGSTDTINVGGISTATMQSDLFAWTLNTTAGTQDHSRLWSRKEGYPIFADDENLPIYKVTFDDDGATNFYRYTYEYTNNKGLASVPKNQAPAEGYQFVSWVKENGDVFDGKQIVSEDIMVSALYAPVVWTINFFNAEPADTLLESKSYQQGSVVSYGGIEPTLASTAKYTYTFKGWDVEPTNAVEDFNYHAVYDSTIRSYAITFNNNEGSKIEVATFEYGKMPSCSKTPTRVANPEWKYSHKGWKPALDYVTEDAVYTAVYDSSKVEYKVVFMNGVTVIDEQMVSYGDAAVAPTNVTRDGYRFIGWNTSFSNITENLTVKALFEEIMIYAVKVVGLNGEKIDSVGVEENGTYVLPTAPQKEGYNFIGFYKGELKIGNSGNEITVNENTTINAVYETKTFVVKFVNGDTELQSEEFAYGSIPKYRGDNPAKTATAKWTYSFKEWSPEISSVTETVIYAAVFDSVVNKYVISFMYGDAELQRSEVAYGIMPIAPIVSLPENTSQYTYSFAGWDKDVVAVTESTTYAAIIDSVINKYEISFKNYDGTLIKNSIYAYGSTVEKPADPTKTATAKYFYTFKDWTPTIANVTANAVYKAVFDSTIRSYTITFVNGSDSLQSHSVAYGDSPKYTGKTPTKASTKIYSYEFTGWSPKIEKVVGEATYHAVFDSTKLSGIMDNQFANLEMSVSVISRNIQISAAPVGSIYAILDMQGRVLKKGRVVSANFNIAMSQAGSYIIRVGNQTQRISVK